MKAPCDEHVWRATGYGGGSATYRRGVTTFRHERCIECGATRRVDFPPADEPKETTT
jgi:hypothetical protein